MQSLPYPTRVFHWLAGLLGGLLLVLIVSATAQAEGGSSIAAAPAVAYGQQEFGNISDVISKNCDYSFSWWTVPVLAGDTLTIDWEAQDGDARVNLYVPGTTDFNYPQTNSVAESFLNNNGKAELVYTASQAGNMPLQFSAYSCPATTAPGPYSFTAYVVHSVRLFIPRRGSLPPRGTVAVGVHTPVGEPISDPSLQVSLEVKVHGHWHSIGQAVPLSGVASVPYALPAKWRHQHVSLRAVAHGSAYHAASSASVRVRVG